jgi:hypothetical protein
MLFNTTPAKEKHGKVVLLDYVFSLRIVAIYRAPHWTPPSATRRGVRRQAVPRFQRRRPRQGTSDQRPAKGGREVLAGSRCLSEPVQIHSGAHRARYKDKELTAGEVPVSIDGCQYGWWVTANLVGCGIR